MLSSSLPDRIEVESRDLSVVMGILPHERMRPQPIDLRLELFFDSRRAAYSGDISETLDYSVLFAETCFLLQTCEFRLVETAAETLAGYILVRSSLMGSNLLSRIKVCLTKTAILPGQTRVSLTVERSREEVWAERAPFESEAVQVIDGPNPVCLLHQATSFPPAIFSKPYAVTVGLATGENGSSPTSGSIPGKVFLGTSADYKTKTLSADPCLAVGVERSPLRLGKAGSTWNIYEQPILP